MISKKEKVLLIDGDILLYKVALSVKIDDVDFDGENVQHETGFSQELAAKNLDLAIQDILQKTGYKYFVICLSDTSNYRKRFWPTYKANRKDVVKPKALPFLRQLVIDLSGMGLITHMIGEELEADDVMGIIGTKTKNHAIWSEDKDLRTIPCKQWCFKKSKFIKQTQKNAIKMLYKQVITGDSVDGYKGLQGYGAVKANALLQDCKTEKECFEVVRKLYEDFYKDVEIAKTNLLEQIGQARILQHNDYSEFSANREEWTYNPYNKFKD